MTAIDDIKERIDIAELIGETVKLRKSGKNYSGFCPFHPNTRTPAFVVFPESGTWRCFGACNEGGDVFKFVMKKEGWDFPEALRRLAERAGVELQPRSPDEAADEKAHERLRAVLEAAASFYRHQLLQTEAGAPVLNYLHGRGLSDAALEAFGVGYAPHAWEAAMSHLLGRGYSQQELSDAGLISERESGGFHDRFRHRIMLPIRDGRGRMAGFGARVVNPDDVPKFLNSPQTVLFDKGRLLYGLDKARQAIRAANQAVIVEGYLDVIALHQAGHANVVSPMGTALTEEQLRLLKRLSRRIVLALDADAAGDQATLRGLTLAREAMDHQLDPVFDSRGLVRYEGRLDADIRVVTLPPGKDPDEVVAADPQAWPTLVTRAQSVVDYVLEVLSASRDLDDPKAKAEVARQVLPLIDEVVDPVERESYRQKLARRLKVDERALEPGARRPRPTRRRTRSATAGIPLPAAQVVGESRLERFCLGLLLHDPELLYRVDRMLQELDLERLSPQDFTGTERQVIFQAIREALAQDEQDPASYWQARLAGPLLEAAQAIQADLAALSQVGELDLQQPKVAEEVLARFLHLRKLGLDTALDQMQFEMLAAQESAAEAVGGPPLEVMGMRNEVRRLALQKARLEQALARRQSQAHESYAGSER